MDLTGSQIIRIIILHEIMGKRWSDDLNRTLKNFSMDANPESELRLHERAIATFLVVCKDKNWSEQVKDECWSAVLQLLLGYDRIDRSKVKNISEGVITDIESYYRYWGLGD